MYNQHMETSDVEDVQMMDNRLAQTWLGLSGYALVSRRDGIIPY